MDMQLIFFIEVLAGGLLAGVMYALVALGFVLIYKASGVFNFAQGAMVFFAALTFVSLVERGVNFWLGIAVTLAIMVVLAVLIERLVLRPLVNQPQITMFMATIGLTFFFVGIPQRLWGTLSHRHALAIEDKTRTIDGLNITEFVLLAGASARLRGVALELVFVTERVGRGLCAKQDDHQAAVSVGTQVHHI